MLSNILRSSRVSSRSLVLSLSRATAGVGTAGSSCSLPSRTLAGSLSLPLRNSSRLFSTSFATFNSEAGYGDRTSNISSVEDGEPVTNVYVGNMPWSITKEEIEELFSEFGTVENIRIQTHADGRPRGFCHITFRSAEDASAAVLSAREEPLHVGGRDLVVDFAKRAASTYTKVEPTKKLYFTRWEGTEEELKATLGDLADRIVSIHNMRDGNTGMRQTNGFIEFVDIESATEAIEKYHKLTLPNGEHLNLTYARARTEGRPRQEGGARRAHYSNREYTPRDGGRGRDW